MENEQKNPFEQFIIAAEKYVDMWNTIEMKVVAIKEDSNYLLGMHATILANSTPRSEILLDLENVIMLREVKSITNTELNGIIRGLGSGIIKIGEEEWKLKDFSGFDFGRSESHRRGPLEVEWDWPYFWLRASGSKSVRESLNEDEINIKLNKWGHEALWSASKENVGFEVGGATLPHIFLTAPIYILVDAQIKEGKLIFSAKCHKSVHAEDISISYGIEGDTLKHDRIGLAQKDMIFQREDFNDLQKIIDLPSETKSIRFWIYYKDEEIDRSWIHKPIEKIEEANPKWITIDTLFSKMEMGAHVEGNKIFERNLGLEAKVPASNIFELAILNLMSTAGFEVIFAGKGNDAQGIDILAFSPNSKDVIAISCTISNNIGEKIRTLLPQINKLNKLIENYELIPAIFAPINPENIVFSDKENGNQHKVALILSPGIRKIYETIQTTSLNKTKKFVLDYIKNKRYSDV